MIEFKQIICPVDFSESSVRAFAHAVAIAQWYDAQLTVLHVVPSFYPVQVRGDLTDPVRVVTPLPREQVLEEMRRSLDLPHQSHRATPVAEAGDPQAKIFCWPTEKSIRLSGGSCSVWRRTSVSTLGWPPKPSMSCS